MNNIPFSNPKEFWKFCNFGKRGINNLSLMKFNGIEYSNTKDIADAFSRHFSSVFKESLPFQVLQSIVANSRSTFYISSSDISNEIRSMKCSKSFGFDSAPVFIVIRLGIGCDPM